MWSRRTVLAAGLSTAAAPALGAVADDYRAALAKAYGGGVDPAAAFARLQAAARLAQARADQLLRGQGLGAGGVGERLRRLAADPRWLYPDSEEGRDRAVADMNGRLAALRPRLPQAFGERPIPAADVRRMSAADVAAGKGGYRIAPSGGQPGVYYVDLRDIRARPAWSLPTVAYHEVVPGHLLQLGLAARTAPTAPAFFEAWGTYAEQLAFDLGAYRDDPRGEIGYLHWRLFRLARGIADLGLHTMGWSRDAAVAAVTELQGFPAAFVSIAADVDRAISGPGRAAAEALTALDLADRRPESRADWPAYHRSVLP
jgi:uncharacterized protein (DUF885 family)